MTRSINISLFALFALVLALTVPACKKYKDIPPYFEDNNDTIVLNSRKVLVIAIDGAVGSEYKTIVPPVLSGMKTHSKHSWEAISDELTTDGASWKTMISGVSYSKHQIKDSTFIYTQPPGGSQHTAPAIYPSFFTYLFTSSKPDTKTSIISSWETMLNKLVPEVEDRSFAANDGAVKDSALKRISNPKSDVIFVHFNGPAKAGKADAFSAASTGYKNAVLQVDGYIGELMTALKARPGYNTKEEWLVIVTGTHGGLNNGYGGSSEKETNVPTFYYNENLKPIEMIRNGTFTSIQMKGRDAAAVKAYVAGDAGTYNAGTGQQTIQIKIKGSGPGAYPHFFSTMDRWPSTPGWSMFTSGANWAISVRSTTTGEKRIQGSTPNVFDNQWHTLTVVIYDSNSSRYVKRFTDATRVVDDAAVRTLGATYGAISSPTAPMLGWGADPGYNGVTFNAADIMIFNTALTDAEVAANNCLADITQHPKYANLVGYWPCKDGFGNRFKNYAPSATGKDFVFQGPFQWTGVTDLPCTTAPPTDPTKSSLLIKAVDVVPAVFYWLRIPVSGTWGLEGSSWISTYEREFIKL